ncbi:MAG: hypothetical protein KJ718_06465 [Nanoarchaeota archaeon]|nr:hypothetical protein [Nanoarchaeota archaeon]MBU1052161.1 hypothetical protein [Nanoarchaeota archaeon]MBU1987977.1 hypothetical protein [Nanoarchaeota archaeon]
MNKKAQLGKIIAFLPSFFLIIIIMILYTVIAISYSSIISPDLEGRFQPVSFQQENVKSRSLLLEQITIQINDKPTQITIYEYLDLTTSGKIEIDASVLTKQLAKFVSKDNRFVLIRTNDKDYVAYLYNEETRNYPIEKQSTTKRILNDMNCNLDHSHAEEINNKPVTIYWGCEDE